MKENEVKKNHKDRKESDSVSSAYEEMEEKIDPGPYPKRVFFILGNEFCERYSYYGMRTILVLYLKFYLEMNEDTATAVYHAFTVLCYLFPLFGAFIADSWLGKYKTIFYLSIVYAIGMVLNTLGACPPIGDLTTHLVLSSIGLFVIAVGTGGIKPCVSSFGGDQFTPQQEEYRRKFFSLFYFAINAGSLLSTAISPIIRDDVNCLGREDCYALAFGIPAVLMVVAIITFVIGTPYYTIKPPEGNIFAEVFRAMGIAIKNRWNTPRKQRNKDHWMDYALTDTSAKLVRDVKYVLRVLILYIPLPLFWTLFDQQGSRWTLQATRMDGYIGSVQFKPDQMQIFNPLFIVTLIPLFEVTLYPCLRKLNINFTPLRRMTLGMILAGISFVLAAVVQTQMDKTLTHIPEYNSEASFRVINSASCQLEVTSEFWTKSQINVGEDSGTLQDFVDSSLIGKPVEVTYNCVGESTTYKKSVTLTGKSTWNMVVSEDVNNKLKEKVFEGIYEKSESGKAIVRIFNSLNYNITVKRDGDEEEIALNNISTKAELSRETYNIVIKDETSTILTVQQYVDTGGIYTIVVGQNTTQNEVDSTTYVDVNPNDVSLFWMIPQYFVITVGEVFLSVTGLEFSYSQAPTSMKSVLASFWLLTVSIGNIIVLIIAEAKFVPSQADEYYLFAGLIGIAAIIFILLAIRYEYVDESEFYETEGERIDTKKFRNKVAETSMNDDKYKAANGDNAHDNRGFEHEYATAF